MALTDFAYQAVGDAASVLSVSILADRPVVLAEWHEDAAQAGLRVHHTGPLADLGDGEVRALGDVVLVDCPAPRGAALAALARLDMRAARAGARLVVATTHGALDAVFGCLDRARPEILVDPSRGERVVALARVMAGKPNSRLRDLSEHDRLTLLRLTEQVGELAERLERMGQAGAAADGSAFRFESPGQAFRGAGDGERDRALLRRPKPPLPDPRLVRRLIQVRQLRTRFFDAALFADPAWDILLDLTAARAEHARVSVTSLCIASGVPPTTALRWIGQMIEAGLLERIEDESDRRRAFIALSDRAAEAMARYFAELGREALALT
jgi:DNA-binding MarR family transcriptional regulator